MHEIQNVNNLGNVYLIKDKIKVAYHL